jgi:hypothetical protein
LEEKVIRGGMYHSASVSGIFSKGHCQAIDCGTASTIAKTTRLGETNPKTMEGCFETETWSRGGKCRSSTLPSRLPLTATVWSTDPGHYKVAGLESNVPLPGGEATEAAFGYLYPTGLEFVCCEAKPSIRRVYIGSTTLSGVPVTEKLCTTHQSRHSPSNMGTKLSSTSTQGSTNPGGKYHYSTSRSYISSSGLGKSIHCGTASTIARTTRLGNTNTSIVAGCSETETL